MSSSTSNSPLETAEGLFLLHNPVAGTDAAWEIYTANRRRTSKCRTVFSRKKGYETPDSDEGTEES
jgi:hypothetical protein